MYNIWAGGRLVFIHEDAWGGAGGGARLRGVSWGLDRCTKDIRIDRPRGISSHILHHLAPKSDAAVGIVYRLRGRYRWRGLGPVLVGWSVIGRSLGYQTHRHQRKSFDFEFNREHDLNAEALRRQQLFRRIDTGRTEFLLPRPAQYLRS